MQLRAPPEAQVVGDDLAGVQGLEVQHHYRAIRVEARLGLHDQGHRLHRWLRAHLCGMNAMIQWFTWWQSLLQPYCTSCRQLGRRTASTVERWTTSACNEQSVTPQRHCKASQLPWGPCRGWRR
jgi:hypothetical protein